MRSESIRNSLYIYSTSTALSLILTFFILDLTNVNLRLPLFYANDEMFHLFLGKTLVDNDWHVTNQYTGAPEETYMVDFPLNTDNFNILLLKILAIFTGNGILAVNLFYIFTFPLVTVLSVYVFRKLGINLFLSIALSLIYSIIPYHFYRSTHHLLLSAYFIIPLGILLCFWISTSPSFLFSGNPRFIKSWNLKDKRSILGLLFIVLIGGSGLYYSFFLSILILATGIYLSSRENSFLPFLKVAFIVGGIFIVLLIHLSPTIIEQQMASKNSYVINRPPLDSELYSFRLTQLLFPIDGHIIPQFARFKSYYSSVSPIINENSASSLGLVSSTGFLFLLFWLISNRKIKAINFSEEEIQTLTLLSILLIIAFLFGTFGGLGAVFAYLINPTVRSVNRLSIIIAFISLAGLGILLNFYLKRIKDKGYQIMLLILLTMVAVLDQTNNSFRINQSSVISEFKNDSTFVSTIELLNPSGKIFQLPYIEFPEGHPSVNLGPYDLFKGYLHSETLKWSFGSVKGRKTDEWLKSVSSFYPTRMVREIRKKGFTGIYIDRAGYSDNAIALENKITDILNQPPLVADNGRLSFFNLKDMPESILINLNESDEFNIHFHKGGNSEQFIIPNQWHEVESYFRWTNGNEAELSLGKISSNSDILIKVEAFPFLANGSIPFQTVEIQFNGHPLQNWKIDHIGDYSITIPKSIISSTDENVINFNFPNAATPKSYGINEDERILAVGFKKFTIKNLQL